MGGEQKAETVRAKFVEGSIMAHVVKMTAAGSVGLIALFLVDLANLFYISLLGEESLAAAIGYASTLVFFNISISIGMMIATGALVSRALGANDKALARRRAGAALVMAFVLLTLAACAMYPFIEPLLYRLGARGQTLSIATGFLQIVLPSLPIMGLGMTASGMLRACGDAKRAMFVTLASGGVTLVLDPILIFVFDLGVTGAAIASVISRFCMALLGLYWAHTAHGLLSLPSPKYLWQDLRQLAAIALPAILTNVATPVGNVFVTRAMAEFGDQVVAGWAVIGRLIPMAFAALFALSGAVGPIFGQNLGARRYDRVQQVLKDSLTLMLGYTLVIWAVLAAFSGFIADAFQASGEMRALIVFFCTVMAGLNIFQGLMFVANAGFNNLGYPMYSTLFNWGRSTLGTIPFIWLGAKWGGAKGVLLGQSIGVAFFGTASVWVAFRVIKKLSTEPQDPSAPPPVWQAGLNPHSTSKAASAGVIASKE